MAARLLVPALAEGHTVTSHSQRRREVQWADKTAGAAMHRAGADDRQPNWRGYSACQDEDPELFFAEKGGSVDEARAICARCFVRPACLAFILRPENAETSEHGVWAGMTVEERRQLGVPRLSPRERNRAAGLCAAGKHKRTEANIRHSATGKDVCRVCTADRARERYQLQKEVSA